MPKQFIQVKRNENVNSNMYSCEEKQDCAKYESSSNISNSNGDICRICHCESDLDNPLLSPCYCSGSLKYVHQSCLRQWLAASDTRSCELCKFNFILHTKIKPLSEWRRLEMTGVERRRLSCAILFHFVAAICVIWSLFVLIDRATEEVQKGLIAWPFWTKLVVVAVGFTGGAVFMYIQCRQYLHLFSRWKAHNRIILVQNAPEKAPVAPSTSYTFNQSSCQQFPSQIVARVEYNNMPSSYDNSNNDFHLCYVFHQGNKEKNGESGNDASNASTVHKADIEVEDLCDKDVELGVPTSGTENQVSREDNGDRTRREILALDIECFSSKSPNISIDHKMKTDIKKNNAVFISLPNLSASSENLLV